MHYQHDQRAARPARMQHADLTSAELAQRGVWHGAWPAGSSPGADAARTSPARVRRDAWLVSSPPSVCGIGHSISQVSGGWARPYRKCPNSLDTYQSTYRNLVLFIFLPILHGYVSAAYPLRIRIGYASDTGYVANLMYPCNVGFVYEPTKLHCLWDATRYRVERVWNI